VNVNSPFLGISSDLTKEEAHVSGPSVSCPESQPVQKSSLNCGKLHLTNDAIPLSPGTELLRVCQYSAVGGAGSMVTSSVRSLVVRVRIRRGPRVLDARRGSQAGFRHWFAGVR
jgi:hypothetical protein